jgi:5-methyltetrahydropteroyltriglutamate--homocysteine methyltransferase
VKRSSDKIRTTHAGQLPVPPSCADLPFRLYRGEAVDPPVIEAGIADVVRKQLDIGIDCIGDGEFWKSRGIAYYSSHFSGIETRARPARRAPSRASVTSSRSSTRTATVQAACSSSPARSRFHRTASA